MRWEAVPDGLETTLQVPLRTMLLEHERIVPVPRLTNKTI
jgi:hypothetical protein